MNDDIFDPKDFDRHDPEWKALLKEALEKNADLLGERSEKEVEEQFNQLCDAAKRAGSDLLQFIETIRFFEEMRKDPRVIQAHQGNKQTIARADWTIDDTIVDLLNVGIDVVKEDQTRAQIDRLFEE